MYMSLNLSRFVVMLTCLIGLVLTPLTVFAEKTPPSSGITLEAVTSRVDNLTRLVTVSKGAQRVKSSGNENALSSQQRALDLIEIAKSQIDSQRYQEANKTLNGVTKEMFAAIRLVGNPDKGKKKSADFERRASSVKELLAALGRITDEKHTSSDELKRIQNEVERARKVQAKGDIDTARKILDNAYVDSKKAIEGLRGGDTLVRSLNFASKEEEYHYELDRNDTHKMLVKVLLKEKMEKESLKKMVNRFVAKAEKLRGDAAKKANTGDHDSGVKLLEKSTKELVRAIRMGGVYIPG